MKCIVATQAGDPDVLKIEERDIPKPESPDEIIIKVKAFGLNRAEMYTRQGHSPGVKFPRVLGIECVGEVEEDPLGRFDRGQQVAAIMGGMGRLIDGGYTQYAKVPRSIAFGFQSDLDWSVLGAIPEMFQTAYGSLFESLQLKKGEWLLVRGGTSSVGMMAAQLAKTHGAKVAATTRSLYKIQSLRENGADEVFVDTGNIHEKILEKFPKGMDKVLELVGTATLLDSLKCVKKQGICCMTGILGNSWELPTFSPMYDIPSGVCLTSYAGDAENLTEKQLQSFMNSVECGDVKINLDRVFQMDEIVEAHRYMENSQAKGKLVVLTGL